jgi:hypothetical protein
VILDGVFSKVNTPRGKVTDQVISDLEELLYVGMGEWKRMGQSATPKWHMLLDHVPDLLKRTGGFVDMGEDAIERSHQRRVRDEARLIRLRNDSAIKLSQAKFQNTRMIQEVMDIKQQVHNNSKRNFKKEKTVGEERAEAKRQKRVDNRNEAVEATKEQDKTKVLLGPRVVLEKQLMKHLEDKESNEAMEIGETTE